MTPIALLALAFAAGSAVPALSQEAQCIQNESHLVIWQERTDAVGADFIIRPPARGKIACVFAPVDGDVLIGAPEDPLHYLDLRGDYLILTRSTGPDGDLVIYDLTGDVSQPVLDVPADDEVTVTDEVTYWQRTGEASAGNCPQYAEYTGNGLGAVIAEERVFDPATGDVTATGQLRCSATQ